MRTLTVCLTVCALIGVITSSARATQRGWTRPVDGPVLRLFAVNPDRFAAGQHRGVDLGAPPGATVAAVCGGRVTFAGTVPGGGRTVSVRCGRLVATYQHLGVVTARRGRIVLRGARIGTVGHARPRAHVHLGARDAASGAYVDPLGLFGAAPRAAPPLSPTARRPRPLGPAPRAWRPLPAGHRVRSLERALPRPAPPPVTPRAERLPWPVWLGLALVVVGLPLGGAITVRTRRQRARAPLPRMAS